MDSRWLKKIIGAASNEAPSLVLKNANVVNVFTGEIINCDVAIFEKTIIGLGSYSCEKEFDCEGKYLCPGFIDSHLHVESSMAAPWEYARLAMKHGTTMAIADPHEIANVAGVAGVRFMVRSSENIGMDIYYMLPSSVPCASFEQNNAHIRAKESAQLIWEGIVYGMGELTDSQAVLKRDDDMMQRLNLVDGRVIDGCAAGLSGAKLFAYMVSGASTCRELDDFDDMIEKLRAGMLVQLRVGSAANKVDSLFKKIAKSNISLNNFMFCSDDKSAYSIAKNGHINHNARLTVKAGISAIDAVKMATINTAKAYRLVGKGAIAAGYDADMVLFEDLKSFKVKSVFIGGKSIDDIAIQPPKEEYIVGGNSINFLPIDIHQLKLSVVGDMPVMEMPLGQLKTKLTYEAVPQKNGAFVSGSGYQKIVVVERHKASGTVGLGIVKGFNLNSGALASSVSHDSNNIVAIGGVDEDILLAAERVRDMHGGYALVEAGKIVAEIPLPIAGLMADIPIEKLVRAQNKMLKELKNRGVDISSDPFVRLAYHTYSVLPEVRVTTYGMYDVNSRLFL